MGQAVQAARHRHARQVNHLVPIATPPARPLWWQKHRERQVLDRSRSPADWLSPPSCARSQVVVVWLSASWSGLGRAGHRQRWRQRASSRRAPQILCGEAAERETRCWAGLRRFVQFFPVAVADVAETLWPSQIRRASWVWPYFWAVCTKGRPSSRRRCLSGARRVRQVHRGLVAHAAPGAHKIVVPSASPRVLTTTISSGLSTWPMRSSSASTSCAVTT